MPVKTVDSVQLAEGYRKRPTEDHGKVRTQICRVVNTVDVADPTSTFNLFKLPPGAVRVLPHLCRVKSTAFGAARTVTLGHRKYTNNPASDPTPEDAVFYSSAIDVSAAAILPLVNTNLKLDQYSKAGITVFATLAGGTAPIGAELEVEIAYVYE